MEQTTDRSPRTGRAARWCGSLALVAGVFATGFLIQWGNRYYIARIFFGSDSPATLDEARYDYDLLSSAHDALVAAVVALLTTAVLTVARARLRRHDGRPSASVDATRPGT